MAVFMVLSAAAAAQTASPLVIELPPVDVVGAAPLLGSGVDRGKVPAATHVLNGGDIARTGVSGLAGALDAQVGGVALDDAAGNQFQPALLYRGFTASPLDGTAQGLAVYVNGARFNLPFGDTVNWDLIPSQAIDTANLEGANPVFGLNALGGSLSVQLKNGFTYHGGELVLSGGSFGRVEGAFQYGRQSGDFAAYAAGGVLHDGGWRQSQTTDLHQFFGDAGWRGARSDLHVSVLAARDGLSGPGTIPVQLLAADRDAAFTVPDAVQNTFARVSVTGNHDFTDTLSLQGVVYYTSLQQKVVNSNTPNFQVCGGFLCAQSGAFLTDRQGNPIADFLHGGPYGELDNQTINTNGYGAALQASDTDALFGLPNHFVVGASFDGGVTTFSASPLAGGLTADRGFVGPGVVIDQADGSIAPVRVDITSAYYGLYATDILDVTPHLSLNLSGRLNLAKIDLRDQLGSALNGDHYYVHFNPGIGLTYTFSPAISVYGSFSVANRAPTPAELSCASIASPCTLANFFVADPNLKQVVAQTVEVGLRGKATPYEGATLRWNVGLYRTNVSDDIVFLPATIPGQDFFQNVGLTRRQGIEAGMSLQAGSLRAWLDYAFTGATFETAFTEDSPLNPASNAAGQIPVMRGDQLPGVPRHRLKLGLSYDMTEAWTAGFSAVLSSGQYLFGDEANLTSRIGGYVVLNLDTQYRITPNIEIFAQVRNALNAKYETFGTFSDTASVPIAQVPGASNTRALSPAPPIAGYGGVRMTF
jgi:outer membrane receptor protein involved in Fe transport